MQQPVPEVPTPHWLSYLYIRDVYIYFYKPEIIFHIQLWVLLFTLTLFHRHFSMFLYVLQNILNGCMNIFFITTSHVIHLGCFQFFCNNKIIMQ